MLWDCCLDVTERTTFPISVRKEPPMECIRRSIDSLPEPVVTAKIPMFGKNIVFMQTFRKKRNHNWKLSLSHSRSPHEYDDEKALCWRLVSLNCAHITYLDEGVTNHRLNMISGASVVPYSNIMTSK